MKTIADRRTPVLALRVLLLGLCLGSAAPGSAQLGSRPAADWIPTLDAPARVEAMRLPELLEALKIEPGTIVADVGAGSGVATAALARATGPSGLVYASDIDPALLVHIDSRMRGEAVANVKTVLGSFTDPMLPEPVGLAFMNDVLHHVEDRGSYLQRLAGHLGPGGRLVVVEYTATGSPHRGQPSLIVTEAQTDVWARAAGLRRLAPISLYDDRYVAVYARQ